MKGPTMTRLSRSLMFLLAVGLIVYAVTANAQFRQGGSVQFDNGKNRRLAETQLG